MKPPKLYEYGTSKRTKYLSQGAVNSCEKEKRPLRNCFEGMRARKVMARRCSDPWSQMRPLHSSPKSLQCAITLSGCCTPKWPRAVNTGAAR